MAGRKPTLAATARSLNSAAIHLLRAMRAVDQEAGLTPARLSALSVLVFGGGTALGRLARIEGVTPPTMTRIVDGLEDLRLVTREPHPDSARQVLVAPTQAGVRLMRGAADRRVDAIVGALRRLDAEDRAAIVAAGPALVRLSEEVRR